MEERTAEFEAHRASLLALGYRMLGDVGRAEELVQEAWIRWAGVQEAVGSARAYLVTVMTRLCLNELDSARARREEARGDRLPEPARSEVGAGGYGGLGGGGAGGGGGSARSDGDPGERVEIAEQVSMAFLVLLQRLTPAERAVLLLHEVFDFEHAEIAPLLGRSDEACRQLLRRARQGVAGEKRTLATTRAEHERVLRAFAAAAVGGSVEEMVRLLADDAVLIADPGPEGVTIGSVRNFPGPVRGGAKVAATFASLRRRGPQDLQFRERERNGQPAMIGFLDGKAVFAILLAVADGRIRSVFVQADPPRLSRVGGLDDGPAGG